MYDFSRWKANSKGKSLCMIRIVTSLIMVLICHLLFFFQNQPFENSQSVKQFGSRSGPFCWQCRLPKCESIKEQTDLGPFCWQSRLPKCKNTKDQSDLGPNCWHCTLPKCKSTKEQSDLGPYCWQYKLPKCKSTTEQSDLAP